MMDFRFTTEEEVFRKDVHDFIDKECPKELRGGGRPFCEQAGHLFVWRKKVADKGWVAPAWPKEYGGAGMSIMQQFIYSMETARMRAPAPIFIGALAVAVIGPTIIIYGTEEQKKKHIPKILAGEEMWCQGFSEPGSGSDLASLQTRAVKDGDDYVINGQKIWTTLAPTRAIEPSNVGPAGAQQKTVEDLIKFARDNRSNGVVRLKSDPALRTELAEGYLETEVAMSLSSRVVSVQL